MNQLREDWGDQFDNNMDIVNSLIGNYADEADLEALRTLGQDPRLARLFHKMGADLLEDSLKGKGRPFGVTSTAEASAEIEILKADKDFMRILTNPKTQEERMLQKQHVVKWKNLHAKAAGQ
jgi:hypothetical protein